MQKIAILYDASQIVLSTFDLDEVLERIMETVRDYFNLDNGTLLLLVSEAYRWAFQRNEQFGFAAAYSTLIFLFLLGYSALTRRVVRA